MEEVEQKSLLDLCQVKIAISYVALTFGRGLRA